MRLWHYKLIPYLPKSQLLAQWRELNSIFKKQDKHILINYIYDYPKIFLYDYSLLVREEMNKRKYKIKSLSNHDDYFEFDKFYINPCWITKRNNYFTEHNNEYLTICYYNLKEKYLRNQKDFTKEVWDELEEFYKKETMLYKYGYEILN